MHDEHWSMGYGWDMGFGWVLMILFWVLLIGAVVWLVTSLVMNRRGSTYVSSGQESPLEILDRRLANGEIGVEEYEKVRQSLTGKPKRGG